MKKDIKQKKAKYKNKQKNKITLKKTQLIEQFAVAIGEIIPATVFGNGLCFKNIAKQRKLMSYWNDKHNKKKMLSYFFTNLYRYKPVVFRKIIRENLSEGIERRRKSGNIVLKPEMDKIAEILLELGINMKREINSLELSLEKPLIIPPPLNFQNLIKKTGINEFFDQCISNYLDGYFKDSVRLAFEKIEKLVIDTTSSKDVGKKLMSTAFNEIDPKIRLNSFVETNRNSRQEGFKFLLMGAMLYYRNPLSHGDEPELNHNEAYEMLCFANNIYNVIIESIKS